MVREAFCNRWLLAVLTADAAREGAVFGGLSREEDGSFVIVVDGKRVVRIAEAVREDLEAEGGEATVFPGKFGHFRRVSSRERVLAVTVGEGWPHGTSGNSVLEHLDVRHRNSVIAGVSLAHSASSVAAASKSATFAVGVRLDAVYPWSRVLIACS